jgi:hypothetical protein
MATHPDGTMDVMVDSKPERRKFQMVMQALIIQAGEERLGFYRAEPELKEKEVICWIVGDEAPRIFTSKERYSALHSYLRLV